MLRVGVDVGGTFTDVVLWDDESGTPTLHKLPSTPADPSVAALEGIETVAKAAGTTMEGVQRVSHGTTLATNVVVQHRGAERRASSPRTATATSCTPRATRSRTRSASFRTCRGSRTRSCAAVTG